MAEEDARPAFDAPAVADSYLGRAQELMMRALSLMGIRYRYGGESPATGFDCSGFVRYVYNQLGTLLPRSAAEISNFGRTIDRDELRPGDLVFFNTLRRPFSHVGIYVGDQRFIHSPSRGGQIEIVSMSERYWEKRFNGARRVDL